VLYDLLWFEWEEVVGEDGVYAGGGPCIECLASENSSFPVRRLDTGDEEIFEDDEGAGRLFKG
jgi:hypothetical protein